MHLKKTQTLLKKTETMQYGSQMPVKGTGRDMKTTERIGCDMAIFAV
jgi:hypothetical protein